MGSVDERAHGSWGALHSLDCSPSSGSLMSGSLAAHSCPAAPGLLASHSARSGRGGGASGRGSGSLERGACR